jgi:uncharacterized protein (DUF433 family)
MSKPHILLHQGQPVLAGTLTPVADVLKWLASGHSLDTITRHVPELTRPALVAALHYAVALLEAMDGQKEAHLHQAAARRLAEFDFDQAPTGDAPSAPADTSLGFMGLIKPK